MTDFVTSKKVLAAMTLCIVGTSSSATAQVSKLSPERFQQYGSEAFWEVDVNCEGYDETILIRQQVGGADWCMPSRENYCDSTKVKLSQRVCSAESLALMASEPEPEPAPAVESGPTEAERAAAREAAIARENNRRAAAAARLRTEQQKLLAERQQIEKEKAELQQLESQLQARVEEIQQALDEME